LTSVRRIDADEARQAGIDAQLAKPVRSSELHNALVDLVAATSPPAAERAVDDGAPPAPVPALGRVLVVEDNQTNQLVAEGMLRSFGFDVDVAGDGREALTALASRRYDAVLMDCHMPEMDGFEATAELRRREPAGRRTPVIAMTAGVFAEERERCLESGMDDFVSKPIDSAQLQRTLVRWAVEGSVPDGLGHDVPERDADGDVVDAGRLGVLRSLGSADGQALLPHVVDAFLAAAPAEVGALRAAVDSGDSRRVQEVAHRLRGAASNVGANRVAAICADLEAIAKGGSPADAAQLDRLEQELDRAARALGQALLERT